MVENDPVISDLVVRQSLQAAGYQTHLVNDATTAIARALQLAPDVVIADLNLPGLSGKDLLVAMTSQNLQVPVIVLANKGSEADIIQAFRLGASDYLLWPMREPEVIAVVERALKVVHERRERERLTQQLGQINQELQNRVRELTTIFSIGKAVTSITDQGVLFERILEGAARATQADVGWFLQRTDPQKPFILAGQRGLPNSLAEKMYQAWDDGISSLVALSGESLSIHGEPLKRFKISSLGQAALIVPVKVQKQVIGLLVVMRKAANPFITGEQRLLEAVADYASISLSNAQLFRALEDRAKALQSQADSTQASGKLDHEVLLQVKQELRQRLTPAQEAVETLGKDPTVRWGVEQRKAITLLQEQVQDLNRLTEAIRSLPPSSTSPVSLNDLLRQSVDHFQRFASQNDLSLSCDLPAEVLYATLEPTQTAQIIDGLLSNAIQYSHTGGQVSATLSRSPEQKAHIIVTDSGSGLTTNQIAHIFEPGQRSQVTTPRRFGGLGIRLSLIKEIVTLHKGKIWVESKPEQGAAFHLMLPLSS